jgi:hypothetical protein
MGRTKKVKDEIVKTPSGEHTLGIVTHSEASFEPLDKTDNKKDATRRGTVKVMGETIVVPKAKHKLFDTQVVIGNEQNSFISQALSEYFKFGTCGYRENIKRWDFPLAIGDKMKRHNVYREYFHRLDDGKMIMIDLFNEKTSVKEILRIKAHLEELGFRYTYILGGEVPNDEWKELVFKTRLAKLDPKAKDYPSFYVPKTLEEAKFGGHKDPTPQVGY